MTKDYKIKKYNHFYSEKKITKTKCLKIKNARIKFKIKNIKPLTHSNFINKRLTLSKAKIIGPKINSLFTSKFLILAAYNII